MTSSPTLLVTGASSGIGLATAIDAAARGWRLALVGRDGETLEVAARECRAAGSPEVVVRPADVGIDADCAGVVADVVRRWGHLDHVVGSAGVVAYGRTEDVPAEVFDAVLRTNLLGQANLARHVVPVLRRQRRGTLLLVGSVIGHIAVPSMSPYVVSKWGVRALARQLRIENRDLDDVQVHYVAPGGVDTPIYRQAANYQGFAGRPPLPVSSAERAGRQVVDRLCGATRAVQLTPANHLLRFGFSGLPRLYDRLVGPLYPVGAVALDEPVAAGPGNVLSSRPSGNRLRGGHGSAPAAVLRNVRLRRAGHRPRTTTAGPAGTDEGERR